MSGEQRRTITTCVCAKKAGFRNNWSLFQWAKKSAELTNSILKIEMLLRTWRFTKRCKSFAGFGVSGGGGGLAHVSAECVFQLF
jgi:hypothetical protein